MGQQFVSGKKELCLPRYIFRGWRSEWEGHPESAFQAPEQVIPDDGSQEFFVHKEKGMTDLEYISELVCDAHVGDSHAECIKCNKKAVWVPNENYAQCMACGWRPSPAKGSNRNWLVAYLEEFFVLSDDAMNGTEDERHEKFWQYFASRGISPETVRRFDIGMMPHHELKTALEAGQTAIEEEAAADEKCRAAAPKKSGRPKKIELYDKAAELGQLQEFHEKLESLQDAYEGAIVFFYRNPEGRIVRLRYRKPFAEHGSAFGSTKNICGSGVFGAFTTFPREEYSHMPEGVEQGILHVVEGEFNLLMLEEKLRLYALETIDCVPPEVNSWIWVCALGSSSDPDCKAVASMARFEDAEVKLCYDWDTAGVGVLDKMRSQTRCNAWCVPGEPLEKNGKLKKTADLFDWLKPMEPAVALVSFMEAASKAKPVTISLSLIAAQIEDLRKEKEKDQIDKVNSVKEFLYEALEERGELFNDGIYAYAYDASTYKTWRIDEAEYSKYMFSEHFKLPQCGLQEAVMQALGLKIKYGTQRIETHANAYYDRANFTLYLKLADGRVAKLTPDGGKITRNGCDGVYFHETDDASPIPAEVVTMLPDLELTWGLEIHPDSLLCKMLRANYRTSDGISQEGYETLFLAKYLSMFLPELFTRRTIGYVSGAPDSGKTFVVSKLGWLLNGPKFMPFALSEAKKDQLETLLTNCTFTLIDNYDSANKVNQALLCQACTTGSVPMRALYETNTLVNYPITADIWMTGLNLPSGFKGDLNSRLLEFPILPFEQDGKSETERQAEFLALRPQLLAETLLRLQLILKAEKAETERGARYQTKFRIKDFGLFLKRQAHHGDYEEMNRILGEVVESQQQQTLASNSTFSLIAVLIGRYSNVGTKQMNATYLGRLLNHHAEQVGSDYLYRGNPIGLGKFLGDNETLLASEYGLHIIHTSSRTKPALYTIKPTPDQLDRLRADLEAFGLPEDRVPEDAVMDGFELSRG